MNKPLLTIIFLTAIISLGLQSHFFQKKSKAGSDTFDSVLQANVLVTAIPGGSLPTISAGYCEPGQATVTFTNQGLANDTAQSLLKNLVLGIGLSDNFLVQHGGFKITGIRIAGVDVVNFQSLNGLHGSSQFSADPDGTGGLTDADGDGFFDDLPIGEKVEATVFYEIDCAAAADFNPGTNCLNNLTTEFSARMEYELADGTVQSHTLPNFLQPENRNLKVENFSDPDAFAGIDTFFVTHRHHRSFRDFKQICSNGDQFIIRVALPNGVQPVPGLSYLSKNSNVFLPLQSSHVSGDTLILVFNASQSFALAGDYELRLAFSADCSVELGPTVFPVNFEHYCPGCNCRHLWYCGEIEGPWMHATSPPCAPDVPITCNNGLQTIEFQANRTTFGFSDADFTQPFDPNLANKKVAIGCDSVEMRVAGVVGSTSLNDSIGVVILYENADASASVVETFLFDQAVVRFTHSGDEFSCPVDADALTVTATGIQKKLVFDLSECLANLGLTLDSGDTVEFTGNFYVNPDGPFGNDFQRVRGFRAYTFAWENGGEVECDQFGQTFFLAKPQVVFDFPNSNAGYPSGCQDGELRYRLFVADNDFVDYFGNELRPATKVDSIVFDFDPALLTAFDATAVTVSIPGHPVFGAGYFSIPPLSDFPDGHYVARFDTLSRVPTLNQVEEYTFDLKIQLHPTCAAEFSGIAGNNLYQFFSKISYLDRYYAHFIGDGSCVNPVSNTAPSTMVYQEPIALSLTSLTPVNDTVVNEQVSWTVQLCNGSTKSNADLTWLALNDPTGLLTVTAIENLTNPANPTALPLLSYSSGVFAYTPSLLSNDGIHSTDDFCSTLRITATVNNCGDGSVSLRAGWNCGPYAAPSWTPDLYSPCVETTLGLGVTNLSVSPVQVDFQQVTSVCSGPGQEDITIEGMLMSSEPLVQDDFTLRFIWDENGDGKVQAGELTLAQMTVSGVAGPGNPLAFNQLLQINSSQACSILVQLEAAQTDLCGEVTALLPMPRLLNAGIDQRFCTIQTPLISLSLGLPSCDTTTYQFNWTALPPATTAGFDDVTAANPLLTINPSGLWGQTLTYVLETRRPGCVFSTLDSIKVELPAFAEGFSTMDSVLLKAPSCQATAELCLNISAADLPHLTYFDNGVVYAGGLVTCSDTLFALELSPGSHTVIILDTVKGCTDTVFAYVTCTTRDTVYLELLVNGTDTVCITDAELSGPIVSVSNVCVDESFASYQFLNDTCLIVTGELVGQETACIVACDGAGFCDTTIVITNVLHPLPDGIKDTIAITQVSRYCFDDQLLNIRGSLVSIENLCAGQSGQFVDFEIDAVGFCIEYTGLAVGTESACVRLCDDQGYCDTINVFISVVPGTVLYDTVFIYIDTNVYCFDPNLLPGTIVAVEDLCPDENGNEVIFSINGTCVSYFGTGIGTDTACILIEDEFGNVSLTQLIVSVVKTTPSTFCDTLFVGQTKVFCLDKSELFGPYDDDSIHEACPDEGTGNANIFLEPVNGCVYYQGIAPGSDSACVVICDSKGFCDTTYFCLFVKPYFDPPTLGNDTVYTEKSTPVVIDFLQNDTIFGGIVDVYILDSSIFSGQIILNPDNSFTYIPDDPFCDRWEDFTYVACNPNGCDTATVNIYIQCIELTIFSAISPNNDGVNDYFYIAKIEDFPDNRLWVYNRWGNLVFETRAYKNTWPGTWGPDTDLPDGTYYYILEWTEDGVKTVQRGYFEMFR